MKKSNFLTNRSGLKGMALLALVSAFGVTSCRPDYDLDKKFPEWLGTSIYETLQEGFEDESGRQMTFTNYVKLIEDLGQDAILAKTGSRTLFVADDEAFARFFGPNCPFKKNDGTPVMRYEDLSEAQKNMILMGSTLNNVYQVAMLSSTTGDDGPIVGRSMRRLSSSSIYDTIPIVRPNDLPHSKEWDRFRTDPSKANGIALMQNGTVRPMIFFVNKFLTTNKITDDDYDFLFNQGKYDKKGIKPSRQPQDATVNGTRIMFQNKKCFNGFIHVMEEVVYLLPNMAEYLASSNKAKIYSRIIERFSAPYYFSSAQAGSQNNRPNNEDITKTVNRLVDQNLIKIPHQDSVFTKMYLSRHTWGDNSMNFFPSKKNILFDNNQLLKFDPGWNTYYTPVSGNVDADVAVQENMAVMLVPTDATLMEWWQGAEGGGKALRERYGLKKYAGRHDLTAAEVAEDMDSVDLDVILELVNNNMLTSLTGSVPSKFGNVLNDANDPMFDDPAYAVTTIDSVAICCNGAIYFTTAVYSPTAYRSVSYPTLVNEKLQILKWAVKNEVMSFSAYLNSMVSTYSFFTPIVKDTTDIDLNGTLIWIDPVSFPLKSASDTDPDKYLTAMVFDYSDTWSPKVQADVYRYDVTTGTVVGSPISHVSDEEIIRDRLGDLLDYHIIIGDVEDPAFTDENGYSYFQTKGRGTIRFKNASHFSNMDVAGGWQIETGEKINIVDRIDLSKGSVSNGNGRTYLIDKPLLTSRKSVYDILSDSVNYPEFKEFFNLMNDASVNLFKGSSNDHAIGSPYCVSTFNTYHYTLYVPTNESLKEVLASGKLCSSAYLDSINTYYSQLKIDIEETYLHNIDSAKILFFDSINAFRKSLDLRNIKYPSSLKVDSVSPIKFVTDYVAYEKSKMQNFVKYHIQDNSVYCNAEFNAGYNDDGTKATIANFETAYMDSLQQFVKIKVKGGNEIVLQDKNENTVKVLKQYSSAPSHKALWNIMCREYEYNKASVAAESAVASTQIETSSYVVIHLIDKPLCNGQVEF